MKLALGLGPGDVDFDVPIPLIQRAEALGFDSVWTAETYGADAFTPLAYIAAHTKRIRLGTAIAQLDARTPANLAMCAQTVDVLAGGGRVILGIGLSGPQIVEGWYGRPWGRPSPRLREAVDIVRQVWRRDRPVVLDGREMRLPYVGEGSSGLGKPLRSMLRGSAGIPIYLGTSTPLMVRLTGEIADGWLGFHLVPATVKRYRAILAEGLARRADGRTLDEIDVQATVGIKHGDDVKALLQEPKRHIALYAGGMGAKDVNFHKDAMVQRGYGDAAQRVQELFLAGRRDEAAAAVPDEYVDEEWLVGPTARIATRFVAWRDSGITTLMIRRTSPEILEMIAAIASR